MQPYATPKRVAYVIAHMLVAWGTAHAAAFVGDTTHLAVEITTPADPGALKRGYFRPETIPFPPDNPYTPAKALLGRMLFQDTRLSQGGSLACASCHNPGFLYGNGLAKGIGQDMLPLKRRSPSIINSAWGERFMWDGSAGSLEEQATNPIIAKNEMNLPLETAMRRIAGISEYKNLFTNAFPGQVLSPRLVAAAIATYERTITSGTAPFDLWIEGDASAISIAAQRGFTLFNTKAQCAFCHGGWSFTDEGFHDIGLGDDDEGRGVLLPNVIKMQHAFKTPSLREVARRSPYMHDGSMLTLASVIAYYNNGGGHRPSQSELIYPLHLSMGEQSDIVAFLRTLTSATGSDADAVPALPR